MHLCKAAKARCAAPTSGESVTLTERISPTCGVEFCTMDLGNEMKVNVNAQAIMYTIFGSLDAAIVLFGFVVLALVTVFPRRAAASDPNTSSGDQCLKQAPGLLTRVAMLSLLPARLQRYAMLTRSSEDLAVTSARVVDGPDASI